MNRNHFNMKRWGRGLVFALGLVAACATTVGWYPSKYGADDMLGAANNLTANKTQQAASLIKTGKVYSLAVATGPETPAYGERKYAVSIWETAVGGTTETTFFDDKIETHLGVGTQMDGLGHLGIGHKYYNGHGAEEIEGAADGNVFGAEKFPPIATRGVLLDMAAHFGVDMLEEGKLIDTKDIEAAASKQGVAIGKGDVVLLHTGWLGLMTTDPERFKANEPGIGVAAAQYLADLGVVAIGADTWGLEVLPGEKDKGIYEVHQTLLAKNGVYILEYVKTEELIKDKAYEFFFVVGAPKFKGAVQTVLNPIAIR